ncbi:MAG TPA: ABC transporter permease [Bryobacteraceae bacterium]|jgi:putative ABC transport system permease protein|nr:ABC transporter permease [Bryobacteraceae bacterium]
MRLWWSKMRAWMTGRAAIDNDVAEEVRSHVEMEAAALQERGMTPQAARAAARRHFGNTTAVAEHAHDAWTFAAFENLLKDVRYGVRAMGRSPAFSLVVILTFALGVGVNTAIFSVVDAVLIKPLPYPSSERLVRLGESNGKGDFSVTWGNFNYWRESNRSFREMAAGQGFGGTLTGRGDPVTTAGRAVTAPYYGLLGIRPLLGRLLGEQDDLPGAPATIVLTHPFWSSRFEGDPHIVGTNVVLDGKPFQVVGVAAPLWTPDPVDYYVSLGRIMGKPASRGRHGSIRGLALLKPGVTVTAARADLDGIMRHLAETDPGPEADHRSFGSFLTEGYVGDIRRALMVLMGAAVLILLIACANVAGLLVARNTARAGELALRKAIGAGQFRLVRQLLTENVAIALAGGTAGLAFAWVGLRLLVSLAPRDIPRLAETRIDPMVLLFSLGITVGAGLLAGLAPVLASRRIDLGSALKEGARVAGAGKRRQSLRGAMVVAEVAITLVLAFGSGLLLRSLRAAQTVSPGFDPERLLSFSLNLPGQAYRSSEAIHQFYAQLTADLRRVPGVADVSAAHCPPPMGDCGDWFYSVAGLPAPSRDQVPLALTNWTEPGYFHMMGIPLLQGREFDDTDRAGGPTIAVVNETLARLWWPHESALGHQIKFGGPYQQGDLMEIVGVVGDVRQYGRDSSTDPEMFFPATRQSDSSMTILVRAAGDPLKLMPAIRARVAALDRNLPLQHFATMDAALGAGLARRRFSTLLLTLFAGLAMLLAAVGIYGLLNYWVTSREPEIAVRLALGASPLRILRWTSAHVLRLALSGVAIGAIGGWFAARLLRDMVFGIATHNTATLLAAMGAVMTIALLGAAIPSWRAARVDASQRLHQG